jgi:octopine/nopaline transport system ATP-binding protein
MSGFLLTRRILAPIAFRHALPAYSTEMVMMVKSTALASLVTVWEVTGVAQRLISQTYRTMEVFLCAAAIYLILNFIILQAMALLEYSLTRHRRAAPLFPVLQDERATLNQIGTTMPGTTRLSVRNIRKSFGTHEVLRGISLEARDGDVISLLGASGSGKSTFLRCINLLEIADHGEIWVDGELIRMVQERGKSRPANRQKQVDHIRSELGMVFQSFNLWSHMTILENVIEGPVHVLKRPRAECIAEAEALLEKVGIADKRHAYPAHLSGGQQQRAAIARSLAMKPKVMLFDEPTSALDPGTGRRSAARHALAGRRGHDDAGRHARDELCPQRLQPGDLHEIGGIVTADGAPDEMFGGGGSPSLPPVHRPFRNRLTSGHRSTPARLARCGGGCRWGRCFRSRRCMAAGRHASRIVTAIVETGVRAYGINTGVGALSDTVVDRQSQSRLSRNIILSHACGVGGRCWRCGRCAPSSQRRSPIFRTVIPACARISCAICCKPSCEKTAFPMCRRKGSAGYLTPQRAYALVLIGEGKAAAGKPMSGAERLKTLGRLAVGAAAQGRLEPRQRHGLLHRARAVAMARAERMLDWADAIAR